MENFFIIIPFLVPLIVMYIAYKQYKNKKQAVTEFEKRLAWFERNRWLKYIKTIYIDRGVVKFFSAIWYVPLFFTSIGAFIGLYLSILNYIFPPLPLSEMNYKKGVIKSIHVNKKTADSLVFQQDDGDTLNFYIRVYGNEQNKLVGKPVQIYYAFNRTSSISFGDIVYEVMKNNKSIRDYPYDYQKSLESDEKMKYFGLYSFYIALLSAFMIWIQNSKEKPYHRLYRLNRYKKLQKLKEE